MRSIYVMAPDTQTPVDLTSDGPNIERIVAQSPIVSVETLISEIIRRAAKLNNQVNVVRFLGHGQSGEISIFGQNSGAKLKLNTDPTFDQLKRLRPIFDRRVGGYRKEVYLHACYAASDAPVQCSSPVQTPGGPAVTCPVQGVINKGQRGTTGAPGFAFLQTFANACQVPTVGTADLIIYKSPYNWTFPGRVIYLYPDGQAVDLTSSAPAAPQQPSGPAMVPDGPEGMPAGL